MIHEIDTHVMLLPDTNQKWWDECRASLIGHPINIHITDGIRGNVGKARIDAFKLGSEEYVSYVDPDDIVLPQAFELCLKALKSNPTACGAFTDEYVINSTGEILSKSQYHGKPWNPKFQKVPGYIHHVCVMRRKFVEKCLFALDYFTNCAEFVLKGLLSGYGPWLHINHFGYKWRVHKDGLHHTHTSNRLAKAQKFIAPALLRSIHKNYYDTIDQ